RCSYFSCQPPGGIHQRREHPRRRRHGADDELAKGLLQNVEQTSVPACSAGWKSPHEQVLSSQVGANEIFLGHPLTHRFGRCLIPKDLGFNSWLEIDTVQDVPTPTTRELEILKVLWEQGPCSVRGVHRQLAQHEDLA